MKILAIIVLLFTLTGCEVFSAIIHDEKYTLNIHETPNTRQEFGYNDDYDYVGFMISGKFGNAAPKHEHSDFCPHNIEKDPETP